MIDHNPEYTQGFRDATSNEIREYRNDQESRYRENQIREGWKSKDAPYGSMPMSSHDRLTLTIVGEREEQRREQQRKRTNSSVDTVTMIDGILIIGAIGGFFLLFLKLVN